MRYEAVADPSLASTSITLVESCHTDTLPLVPYIYFHNAEFDTRANAFALGLAVLTQRYCGEVAEFDTPGVGLEFARAIEIVCPQVLSVGPIKGMDRTHSTGEVDILCFPARLGPPNWRGSGDLPLLLIDWSGDFVVPSTRSSAGYRQGRYVTNAALVASETVTSIAIGLMHGGSLCRNLVVPVTEDVKAGELDGVRAALQVVGVALSLVPCVPLRQ